MATLENKFQKANRLAFEQMPEIVKATQEGAYVFTPESVYGILVKKGFAEVNCEIKNDAGECATRATQEGIEKFQTGEEEIMGEESVVGCFEIENVAVVAKRASRSGGTKYPFASLEIGQSFFVPATQANPEPWNKMRSTVGTAITRFAVPVFEEDGVTPKMRLVVKGPNKGSSVQETVRTRIFAIVKDEKDGVAGARIGRTV